MQIVINTDDALSDVDREILGLVLGGDAPAKPAARATGTRTTAKAAPKEEPAEDLLGGSDAGVTMDDVVTGLGVAKVGELKPKQYAEFIEDAASIETD
jgi:hypothetical protein